MTWSNGDVSGSQTLTDSDHLYPAHINELRVKLDSYDFLDDYTYIYNVKSYGAVGDGSTNDTAAIQNAINAVCATGGLLVFPTSTSAYIVNSLITVNSTKNIHIMGLGNKVEIYNINSSGANTITFNTTGSYISNFLKISNINFNSAGTNGSGLVMDNWGGVTFEDVKFMNNGVHGALFTDCYAVKFLRCIFHNNYIYGLVLNDASGNASTIADCFFFGNGEDDYAAGILINTAINTTISGGDFEGNYVDVELINAFQLNFINNYTERTEFRKFRFTSGNGAINIVGNYFQDGNFVLNDLEGCTVSGNEFVNCAISGAGDNTSVTWGINKYVGTSTSLYPASIQTFNSTTQGLLIPRMTTTQRDAIATPVEGLMIFNLTTHVLNFYNGSAWGAV